MDPPPPSPTDSHIGGPLLSGCAHLIVFLVNFALTDNLVLFIILMLIYLKHSFGFIFTGRPRKLLRPSTSSSTMHSSVRRQLVKKSQELLHDLIVVVFFPGICAPVVTGPGKLATFHELGYCGLCYLVFTTVSAISCYT